MPSTKTVHYYLFDECSCGRPSVNCRPPDWPTSAPNRQIEWPMSAALCCQFAVTSRNEQHVVHPSPLIFFEHPVASKGQSMSSLPCAAYYVEIIVQNAKHKSDEEHQNIKTSKHQNNSIFQRSPPFSPFPRVKPNIIIEKIEHLNNKMQIY